MLIMREIPKSFQSFEESSLLELAHYAGCLNTAGLIMCFAVERFSERACSQEIYAMWTGKKWWSVLLYAMS